MSGVRKKSGGGQKKVSAPALPPAPPDPFEAIAEKAILIAEDVPCELTVFRDGLKTMIETLAFRYEMVCIECGGR